MQVDKTTLNDLAIFHSEEDQSVFHHLNFTTSAGGKDWFRYFLAHPYSDLNKIQETQQTLRLIIENLQRWPAIITNGTVMVVDKFYDTPVADIPSHPNALSSFSYKVSNATDYSLIKYSVNHFIDFTKGLNQVLEVFASQSLPGILKVMLDRISMLINRPVITAMMQWNKATPMSATNVLTFGKYLKHHFKAEALELVDIYSKLDAYYGMALACAKYNFRFPEIEKFATPYVEAP